MRLDLTVAFASTSRRFAEASLICSVGVEINLTDTIPDRNRISRIVRADNPFG